MALSLVIPVALASTPQEQLSLSPITPDIYLVERQYPLIKESWLVPELPIGTGHCVSFARELSGIEYYGDASGWWGYINSSEPELGSVIVFNNHIAVVTEIHYLNQTISIIERNYIPWIVTERTLPILSPDILGYITKD